MRRLAMALAGIFFYFLGVYQYGLLAQSPVTWQIVCRDGEGGAQNREDYGRIQEMQEEEPQEPPLKCAFWRMEKGQAAENPQWGRTAQVEAWKVRGSLEVLFGAFVKLKEEDYKGCYLDEGTARELFGSAEVIGSQILCGKRQLTVRGILNGESALLVMRPGRQETTDRITLGSAGGDKVSAARAESFRIRYGIQGTVTNASFLEEILRMFLLLFPGALAVRFFRDLQRLIGGRRDRFPVWAAGWAVWWVMLSGVVWFFALNINIPDTMIPDKWSDFQFWRAWWESAKDSVICFMRREKDGRELRQIGYFVKSAVFLAAPLFCFRE